MFSLVCVGDGDDVWCYERGEYTIVCRIYLMLLILPIWVAVILIIQIVKFIRSVSRNIPAK